MLRTRTNTKAAYMSYSLGHINPRFATDASNPRDVTFNGWNATAVYTHYQAPGGSHATLSKAYVESIDDNPDRSVSEKPCVHHWVRHEEGYVPLLDFGNPFPQSQTNKYRALYYVGQYDTDANVFSQPVMASLDSYRTDALVAMLPHINSGLSIVNFVLELKDLRRMFTVWEKRKSALGNVANAHLNVSFGWLPFFSDIASIVRSLSTLETKLKRLEARAGKISQRRWSKRLDANADLTVDSNVLIDYSPYIPGGTWSTWDPVKFRRLTRNTQQPVFHAKLVYRYTMPGASGVMRKIRGYMSALGLNLDPSIIWNAIPFSFIVDWMIDVGQFLRSFKIDSLDIRTEVLSFTSSVKWQIVHTASFAMPKATTGGTYHPYLMAYQTTIGHYERSTTIPSLKAVTTNNPGIREVALAGSLTSSAPLLPRKVKRALFESSWKLASGESPVITIGQLLRAFLPSFAPNKIPKALRSRIKTR